MRKKDDEFYEWERSGGTITSRDVGHWYIIIKYKFTPRFGVSGVNCS